MQKRNLCSQGILFKDGDPYIHTLCGGIYQSSPYIYVSNPARGKPLVMSSLHFALLTFFVHQEPMGSRASKIFYFHDAIVPNLLNSECQTEMNQGHDIRSLVLDVLNDLNSLKNESLNLNTKLKLKYSKH